MAKRVSFTPLVTCIYNFAGRTRYERRRPVRAILSIFLDLREARLYAAYYVRTRNTRVACERIRVRERARSRRLAKLCNTFASRVSINVANRPSINHAARIYRTAVRDGQNGYSFRETTRPDMSRHVLLDFRFRGRRRGIQGGLTRRSWFLSFKRTAGTRVDTHELASTRTVETSKSRCVARPNVERFA